MAGTLAKSTAKIVIGGGAVYATVTQGVWSTSREGIQAVDKVKTSVLPTANEYAKKMPDEVNNKAIDGWNTGVQWTFGNLADVPSTVASYSMKAVSEVKKSLTST